MTKEQATNLRSYKGEVAVSSLRVAEITGKAHDKVVKDIERILTECKIDVDGFGGIYLDKLNRKHRHFVLPERELNLIVSGYSAVHRLRLIDTIILYKQNESLGIDQRQDRELFEVKLAERRREADAKINALESKFLLEQLEMLSKMSANFDPIQTITNMAGHSILSENLSVIVSNTMSEIRPTAPVKSPKFLLEDRVNLKKNQTIQTLLVEMGLMESYEMEIIKSRRAKIVIKYKLTNTALYFGYNKHSSSLKELPYQVVLYEDRANKLIQKIDIYQNRQLTGGN